MQRGLLLLGLLMLCGCSGPTAPIVPALDKAERQALSQKTIQREARIKKQKQKEQEQQLLRSRGSNWPCPKTLPQAADGVAFAIRCKGGMRGRNKKKRFPSASASKALLLVAFLREGLSREDYETDLVSMIRFSDNNAASRIYTLLGDDALRRMAEALGMRDVGLVGYWSSILLSPADFVRFWSALPRALPRSERAWALRLLGSPIQRWGLPEGAGDWRVFWKGGWRPEGSGWLVLQGGLLRQGEKRLAIAVFTQGMSFLEGQKTIKKTTEKILFSSR